MLCWNQHKLKCAISGEDVRSDSRKKNNIKWKKERERKHERIIWSNWKENSGEDVYDDICDQIEGKENGEYILLSKFDDDVVFEYHITIQNDDFNLGILTMKTPEGVFEVDFDEE